MCLSLGSVISWSIKLDVRESLCKPNRAFVCLWPVANSKDQIEIHLNALLDYIQQIHLARLSWLSHATWRSFKFFTAQALAWKSLLQQLLWVEFSAAFKMTFSHSPGLFLLSKPPATTPEERAFRNIRPRSICQSLYDHLTVWVIPLLIILGCGLAFGQRSIWSYLREISWSRKACLFIWFG